MSTTLSQDIVISIIEDVLQRYNPAHNHNETCVGQTLNRDRCRKAYNGDSAIDATTLIRRLSLRPDDRAGLSEGLLKLAGLILCRGSHGNQSQAPGIAQKWFRRIVRILDSPNPPLNLPSQSELLHHAWEMQGRYQAPTTYIANREQRIPTPSLLTPAHATTNPSRTVPSDQARDVLATTTTATTHEDVAPPAVQDGENVQTTSTPEAHAAGDTRCYKCHQPMTEPVRTPTGHEFCSACISKWLVNNKLSRLLKAAHLVDPETECPLCREEFTAPARTPCSYCGECVTVWVQEKEACPTCRKAVKLEELVDMGDG